MTKIFIFCSWDTCSHFPLVNASLRAYGNREFNFEVQFPIKNQAAFRSSSKTTCGCLNPKHLRGLKFSRFSTADSASAVTTLKSLPLGTYCRSRPLLFSFCPRSHALYGCAKYTCASSSAATRSCSTNSLPFVNADRKLIHSG